MTSILAPRGSRRMVALLETVTKGVDDAWVTITFGSRKTAAGGSAERRYRELRRAWRRRVLPRLRMVMWPIIALGVAGSVLPGAWRWTAGFTAGCLLCFWIILRDQVPRHIERWLDGAEGERWTAGALRPLEREGWVVAHDLQSRYGNVDHLLVGPGGVFLLDSKNWFGDVTVQRGAATVTPRDNPDAAWSWPRLGAALRGASAANKEALEKLTGVRAWVQPVVVVWAPFAQGCVETDGTAYVAGERLADWLRHRPVSLTQEQVAKLGSVLGGM